MSKETIMKCLLCKGTMDKSTVAYTVDREGYHLYIQSIPAYVCTQCGEKYFEENEVSALQDMIKTFENKLEEVQKVA